MVFCKGYTQNNVCCTNEVFKEDMCKLHHKKRYDECSVCMDNMYVQEKLACGHTFCKNCIYKWKGETCPLCRSIMFFVNHNKEVTLEIMQTYVKKTDEKIRCNTLDEHSLQEALKLFMENTWAHVYDNNFTEILFEYVAYGLQLNPKSFKKLSKILEATSLRLSK